MNKLFYLSLRIFYNLQSMKNLIFLDKHYICKLCIYILLHTLPLYLFYRTIVLRGRSRENARGLKIPSGTRIKHAIHIGTLCLFQIVPRVPSVSLNYISCIFHFSHRIPDGYKSMNPLGQILYGAQRVLRDPETLLNTPLIMFDEQCKSQIHCTARFLIS